MTHKKSLKIMLIIAAGLAAMYGLIDCFSALCPAPFCQLGGMPDPETALPVGLMLASLSLVPLYLAGVCIFGAMGDKVTRGKATALLVMMGVYFAAGQLVKPMLTKYMYMFIARAYSANIMATYASALSVTSMFGVLLGVAWTLAVAAAAIMFWCTGNTAHQSTTE